MTYINTGKEIIGNYGADISTLIEKIEKGELSPLSITE